MKISSNFVQINKDGHHCLKNKKETSNLFYGLAKDAKHVTKSTKLIVENMKM